MDESTISFPNLGITLHNVGKHISFFGIDIAYYGIIIGVAILAGIALAMRLAKKSGQNSEDYLDFAIYAVIFSIIGARFYYVVFMWDLYKDDVLAIFNLREGGLAIYGGVIAAVCTLLVYVKIKKKNFWVMADTGCVGLVLGQIIGRWGNFFNREVFGEYTNNLFAMKLPLSQVRSADVSELMRKHMTDGCIQVHPTFLYESLWNLGLLIFLLIYGKRKKFDGEILLMYFAGYGIGRMWIEGIRTDTLFLFHTKIPVSQLLAAVMATVSIAMIIWKRLKLQKERGKAHQD